MTTSALITAKGELLIMGMNDEQQLGVGEEIGKSLFFFPQFVKKDCFDSLKVIDVSLGAYHTMVLCWDEKEQRRRVFGFGSSQFGQIGYGGSLTQYLPVEIDQHSLNKEQVAKVCCGALHTLFLTN